MPDRYRTLKRRGAHDSREKRRKDQDPKRKVNEGIKRYFPLRLRSSLSHCQLTTKTTTVIRVKTSSFTL